MWHKSKPTVKAVNHREHLGERIHDEEVVPGYTDWQARISDIADGVLMLIATLAVVGSAWAVGDLLTLVGWNPAISWCIAVIADLFWLACHVKAWTLRYDRAAAAPAVKTGKIMLIGSIAANAAHALVVLAAGLPIWQLVIAVAITAALPLAGKVAMRLTMPDHAVELRGDDLKALDQKRAALFVQVATAEMRKDLLRVERKLARITGPSTQVEQLASTDEQQPSTLASNEQAARPVLVAVEQQPSTPPVTGHEQPSTPLAAASKQPSMAELARELLAQGASKDVAAARIMQVLPTAKEASVKAEVRRQANKLEEGTGFYK